MASWNYVILVLACGASCVAAQRASTSHVDVFASGTDKGWISKIGMTSHKEKKDLTENPFWWLDKNRPEAFSFFSLDALYSAPYFKQDHINGQTVRNIVDAQDKAFHFLTGSQLHSIAEFGGAGGWFTAEFAKRGFDYQTIEGTQEGVRHIKQRHGVDSSRIQLADLRLPLKMNRPQSTDKFHFAMNTEVAEHIELPFHSQLVLTLTQASDLIWFSYAPPRDEGGNFAHVHHSAELPKRYWLNLFNFFGYGALEISPQDQRAFAGRGKLILYRYGTLKRLPSLNLRTVNTTSIAEVYMLPPMHKTDLKLPVDIKTPASPTSPNNYQR